MTATALDRTAIQALAAHIRNNRARVCRDLDGVRDLPRFREMGKKGYLTQAELEAIGTEKSSRRKELLSENGDEVVVDVTRKAFAANSERERIRLLCSLKGVAVPRASAILSWTQPDRWPVIDIRAWKTLVDHKVVTGRIDGKNLGVLQWEVFLKAVEGLRRELSDWNLSPQQIDRILYQLDADKNGRRRKGSCRQ